MFSMISLCIFYLILYKLRKLNSMQMVIEMLVFFSFNNCVEIQITAFIA